MKAYEFPDKAVYGKILPKTKIYAYASVGNRAKVLFTQQVERITWAYKLSPKTINLPASGYVQEIQVIMIDLKNGELNTDVLAAIDKAIPSPIFFVVRYKNKIRYTASHKRPSEADKKKRVISVYFESEWMKENIERQALPIALDLKDLYQNLLKALIPLTSSGNEPIEQLVARAERIQIMQKEAEKLEGLMKKEKQYNRKVELHSELKNLKKLISALT